MGPHIHKASSTMPQLLQILVGFIVSRNEDIAGDTEDKANTSPLLLGDSAPNEPTRQKPSLLGKSQMEPCCSQDHPRMLCFCQARYTLPLPKTAGPSLAIFNYLGFLQYDDLYGQIKFGNICHVPHCLDGRHWSEGPQPLASKCNSP